MRYILEGNDKELERVIRENRVRVNRGVINITPISECGLITEEDARKILEDRLATKDAKISEHATSLEEKDKIISELTASLVEKDRMISTLTIEYDGMKTHIAELEAPAVDDSKNLPTDDLKELSADDSKDLDLAASANKNVPPADEKKTGKVKTC